MKNKYFLEKIKKMEIKKENQLIKQLKELGPEYVDHIARIILNDPILKDISFEDFEKLTERDIDKIISEEKGEIFTIYIKRIHGDIFRNFLILIFFMKNSYIYIFIAIQVTPSTRICDLKKDIQKIISIKEEKYLGNRNISWKYIWKNYCLFININGHIIKLLDNNKKLTDYNLKNGDQISFLKYKQQKLK